MDAFINYKILTIKVRHLYTDRLLQNRHASTYIFFSAFGFVKMSIEEYVILVAADVLTIDSCIHVHKKAILDLTKLKKIEKCIVSVMKDLILDEFNLEY